MFSCELQNADISCWNIRTSACWALHRITQQLSLEGTSGDWPFQPPAQAGSATALHTHTALVQQLSGPRPGLQLVTSQGHAKNREFAALCSEHHKQLAVFSLTRALIILEESVCQHHVVDCQLMPGLSRAEGLPRQHLPFMVFKYHSGSQAK